jgi:hypothetical protein
MLDTFLCALAQGACAVRKATPKCPHREHLVTAEGKQSYLVVESRPALLGKTDKVRGEEGLPPCESLDHHRLPLTIRFLARCHMPALVASVAAICLASIAHGSTQLVVTAAPLLGCRLVAFPAAAGFLAAFLAAPSSLTTTGRAVVIVIVDFVIVVHHVLV